MFNVIDLFSGVGGLSFGFAQNPNFNVLLANEIDEDISKAYTLNHPTTKMICCDIALLTKETLENELQGKKIDVIIGGPPCQSYSTLGKREMDDRANLFEEYCRVLKIIKPNIFLFENVTGILSMDHGKLFKRIQEEFYKAGYTLKFAVLNAADYGVPQYRERVILVGTLGDNTFEFPKSTHGLNTAKPYITVSDALSNLPPLKSGESSEVYLSEPQNEYQKFIQDTSKLEEHIAPTNNPKLIQIMEALPDGGDKNDLPLEIRPKSGFGNTYAKMWWNKPAPTITRNFSCPSSSRCIHPRDSRALTVREGARLQSFPDSYKFYGSRSKKTLEIGNAVPPLLSIALSNSVLSFLENNNKDEKEQK